MDRRLKEFFGSPPPSRSCADAAETFPLLGTPIKEEQAHIRSAGPIDPRWEAGMELRQIDLFSGRPADINSRALGCWLLT